LECGRRRAGIKAKVGRWEGGLGMKRLQIEEAKRIEKKGIAGKEVQVV
jgi:hypothetical protein